MVREVDWGVMGRMGRGHYDDEGEMDRLVDGVEARMMQWFQDGEGRRG